MPKQSALRQYKAALFDTLSDPVRIKLLRRLSSSPIEVGVLVECLDPAERIEAARHLAVLEGNRIIERDGEGGAVFYSLDNPALQEALAAISENPAMSAALSDPLRIEILEFLRLGPFEQAKLIREFELEERERIPEQLEILITAKLICRRYRTDSVFYEIKQDSVRKVLLLFRDYFEDHLSAALSMISKISFAHIAEESVRLKNKNEARDTNEHAMKLSFQPVGEARKSFSS